jgi:hypothetical protein
MTPPFPPPSDYVIYEWYLIAVPSHDFYDYFDQCFCQKYCPQLVYSANERRVCEMMKEKSVFNFMLEVIMRKRI